MVGVGYRGSLLQDAVEGDQGVEVAAKAMGREQRLEAADFAMESEVVEQYGLDQQVHVVRGRA